MWFVRNQVSYSHFNVLQRLVNEIIDRLLTSPKRYSSKGERATVFVNVFLGTFVWANYAVAYALSGGDATYASNGIFVEPGFGLTVFILYAFAFSLCPIFSWVIASSFERGRPLTFFFYGVLFPSIVHRILRFGFPF